MKFKNLILPPPETRSNGYRWRKGHNDLNCTQWFRKEGSPFFVITKRQKWWIDAEGQRWYDFCLHWKFVRGLANSLYRQSNSIIITDFKRKFTPMFIKLLLKLPLQYVINPQNSFHPFFEKGFALFIRTHTTVIIQVGCFLG